MRAMRNRAKVRCAARKFSDVGRLKVDASNVVYSSFANISGYDRWLIHEFVWRDFEKWSDRTAVVCAETGRSYSYGQLKRLSERLASSIWKLNILPGETVAVVLPNIPEFPIIALAMCEAGVQATFVNPTYTVKELRRQIEDSRSTAVFTVPSTYSRVKSSIENNPNIKVPIIVIDDGTPRDFDGYVKFEELLTEDATASKRRSRPTGRNTSDTAFIPYSSGTTGLSKGVELSHQNIVANVMQFETKELFPLIPTTATYQDVIPGIIPFFHIYGLVTILLIVMRSGAKLVCMPKFSLEVMVNVLRNHQPTLMHVVPPLVQLMILSDRFKKDDFKALNLLITGAAPIGEKSLSAFRDKYGDIPVIQGYGLTESAPGISFGMKDTPLDSVGYLLPNTQMRIVGRDDDDNYTGNLGCNSAGEIWVRGPQVMKGYYRNPKATADTKEGEWLKTGDLGMYNEQGQLFIQGRFKELIKTKGFQVPPAELEEILRTHEQIEDVAVIGIDDDVCGQIPKAFVVTKGNKAVTEDEIKDFVAAQVVEYKRLAMVQFIDQIPKNASGKILRRQLQNM